MTNESFPICVGHSAFIAKFLDFFVHGKCPSVWLFSGLPGLGKRTLCQILSTFVTVDFSGKGLEPEKDDFIFSHQKGSNDSLYEDYGGAFVEKLGHTEEPLGFSESEPTMEGCYPWKKGRWKNFSSKEDEKQPVSNPHVFEYLEKRMEEKAFRSCFLKVCQRQHPLIFSFDAQESDITQHIREIRSTLLTTGTSWRIVIITNVDALNRFASGALLKILEDPPSGVLFFLTTDCPDNVLPTIFSRCFHRPLLPLRFHEMTKHFEKSETLPVSDVYFWTMGCLGRIKEYVEIAKSSEKTDSSLNSVPMQGVEVSQQGYAFLEISKGSSLWELLTETRKMLTKTLQASGLNLSPSETSLEKGVFLKNFPILNETLLQKLSEHCHEFREWVFLWLYGLALKNPTQASCVYELMMLISSKFQAYGTYHLDPLFFVQDIFVTIATALSPFHWEGIHVL